jgi:hypothetical protein
MAVQAKVLRRCFSTVLQQEPNGLDRQSADRQRTIHGPGQFPEFARFQEPKHLDELAAAIAAQFCKRRSESVAQDG